MSCFCGQMREYRNLSIDRFDGRNLKSKCFFLSHIHEDHTVGLDRPTFLEMLQSSSDVYLYCSEVTKLLLLEKAKYSNLEHHVRVLHIDVPTNVSIPQQGSCKIDTVQVTLLHASHCPGSVMFLFEGSEGTCLYTGDFRWDSQQISNMSALHDKNGSVKLINSLYIDTTFCHESSVYIPSRQDSANAVYNLVKEWIGKGPNYVVHFTARTQYGHEHLMKDVSIKTGYKVYVSKEKCEIYKKIPGLEDIFTSDPSETPVHACKGKWPSDSAPWGKPSADLKVMVILPSTMYFTMLRNFDLSHIVIKKGFLNRVCYSFHSSYTEVKDLVTYLQPNFVRPNVKPLQDDTIMKVQGRLNEFLKLKNSKNICDSQKPRLLGKLRRSKFTKKRTISENSSDSIDLNFGTPEKVYPPAKKSRIMSEAETDEDEHSSYAGSNRSDSEMSDICESDKHSRPQSLSLPGQSLLDALDDHEFQASQGSQSEALECRVCLPDDDEQTTAVVVPTKSLEAGEYKIEEETSDDSEGDTAGANRDDVVDSIGFDHNTTDDVQQPSSISRCETLSTPGQSLLAAVDEMEAEVVESQDSIINSKRQDRTNSYGDDRPKTLHKKNKLDFSQDEEDDRIKTAMKQDRLYSHENDGLNMEKKENKSNIVEIERVPVDTKKIQNGSGSYEDNFINFLKNGNKNFNQNSISKLDSIAEKDIDKMISNGREKESDVGIDQSIESDLIGEEDNVVVSENNNQSNQSSNSRLNTRYHKVDHTENKSNEVVTIIDSSCSTVCESLPHEVIVSQESNSKSSRNGNKNQKEISSSYDLFGSDEGSDDDGSDMDSMITNVCNDTLNGRNKCEKEVDILVSGIITNTSKNKEKGRKEEILSHRSNFVSNGGTISGSKPKVNSEGHNNDCVVLESEDEEERSLLSGKLSRSNSFQSKGSVNCQISSLEKCVTKAVNKLFSGQCQNTAIDCDDLSDSEETIPPIDSQHSDASIETLSPFVSPVKFKPVVGQRSLGDSMLSGSPSKKSPMKNQSIKQYLSPVKNQSPQKVVCQMGNMYVMNNEGDTGEESAENSMIDLTASDDSDDDDKNGADDSTQDYYVID
ncbi:protein artemis-like [Mytilus californianus]|uniref:protein artemis-like n=1 Tax=Mytilus californianus TaxID=6549 RepID=UPI002245A2B4|nr:protein artemis-like [Mytilus californianus]